MRHMDSAGHSVYTSGMINIIVVAMWVHMKVKTVIHDQCVETKNKNETKLNTSWMGFHKGVTGFRSI